MHEEPNEDDDELEVVEESKVDIKKKVKAKETERDKLQTEYHARVNGIEAEAAKEMEQYHKRVEITPLLIVKAIIKF